MATKVFKGVKSTALPDTYVNSPASVAPLFSASTAYAKGDQVYNGLKLYRFTANHAAGVWTGSDVEEVTVGGQLKTLNEDTTELKQDLQEFPNGNYPNMTAGNANQLVSTVFIEDEVPYNFRTSGGSADIGDREYDEIVGVSMPINQLVKSLSNDNWSAESGVTATYDNGVVTISSATSGNGIQHRNHIVTHEHKYFATMSVYGASGLTVAIAGIPVTSGISIDHTITSANTWQTASKIVSCGLSGNMALYALARGGTYENVKMKDIRITDLTIMLGTTIADYVYGLEQSTAGSGVTWLKHHFPKIFDSGYIPYNAGEMQSVSGLSAHRMTGFNQWNEEWELGVYDTDTGAKASSSTNIRTKNPVPVVPNTAYEVVCPTFGMFGHKVYFDKGMNFIGYAYSQRSDGKIRFTTPANAWYVCGWSGSGTTSYSGDVCMHLIWDGERDGQYEEYKEYEYALDDSVVLRGKLELDSNNNLRANGDRYLPDGTIQRNWAEVDLGNLTWSYQESTGRFIGYISNIDKPSASNILGNIICDKYVTVTNTQTHSTDKTIGVSQYGDIAVKDTSYGSDAVAFKTGVTGNKLTYKLATPTTETAEPYQTPQIVDDWGTEEYVSTSLVPVGHDTKYANNLRAKLEMSPDSPEEDGDYIVRHNNGENQYVALGSTTTIQGILDRLTALENA